MSSAMRTTAKRSPAFPRFSLMRMLGNRLSCGLLDARLPDGAREVFDTGVPGPHAVLMVNSPRLYRRMILRGALGFGEAYVAGDCDSPDLRAVLELAIQNHDGWGATLRGRELQRRIANLFHLLRDNNRRGARKNIAAHYDLGNEFYSAWLDRTMTYSAGMFGGATATLEEAQNEKYRHIAKLCGLSAGMHVLEVGCGWGGFASFAAGSLGCRVTAVTISQAQYEYVRQRIAREGMADRVDVMLSDYRDIKGQYDRIVSIEMVEAVGERHWSTYFDVLRERLVPGGKAALQAITISPDFYNDYRRGADFIQTYIFPGGMLPTPGLVREHAEMAGLRPGKSVTFGEDYARTLDLWLDRFEAAWPSLSRQGFDERFRRMWRYYLLYCSVGFRSGRIDVEQSVFSRV